VIDMAFAGKAIRNLLAAGVVLPNARTAVGHVGDRFEAGDEGVGPFSIAARLGAGMGHAHAPRQDLRIGLLAEVGHDAHHLAPVQAAPFHHGQPRVVSSRQALLALDHLDEHRRGKARARIPGNHAHAGTSSSLLTSGGTESLGIQ